MPANGARSARRSKAFRSADHAGRGTGRGRPAVRRRRRASARPMCQRQTPDSGGGRFLRPPTSRAWRGAEIALLRRADRVINVRGFKVDPVEVEHVIASLAGVDEVVVTGTAGPDGPGTMIRAVVACRSGALDAAAITAWCRPRLAEHKVPRSVAIVDALPRTARGKSRPRRARSCLAGWRPACGRRPCWLPARRRMALAPSPRSCAPQSALYVLSALVANHVVIGTAGMFPRCGWLGPNLTRLSGERGQRCRRADVRRRSGSGRHAACPRPARSRRPARDVFLHRQARRSAPGSDRGDPPARSRDRESFVRASERFRACAALD